MILPALPRRRWLRVSLRALMVLVLLVGGVVGWLAHTIRTQRVAIAAIQEAGGQFTYDWQDVDGVGQTLNHREPPGPPWLRRWVGDELFQSVRTVRVSPQSTATVAAVSGLGRLDDLMFYQVRKGVAFDDLRRLTHLRWLTLVQAAMNDDRLAAVGQIASLKRLTANNGEETDAGLAHLAGLQNLTYLDLFQNERITDAGLAHALAGMPRLRELRVVTVPASMTASLGELARSHPDLESLELQVPTITDADLALIGRLTKLEKLVCSSPAVTDAGVAHLAGLTRLRHLNLWDEPITDAGLAHLAGLAALEDLDLHRARLTDAGLVTLTRFPRLTNLTMMDATITDAGMASFGRLPWLTKLSLGNNPGITDAGMTLANLPPQLKSFFIGRTQVSPAHYQALRAARPQLRILPDI